MNVRNRIVKKTLALIFIVFMINACEVFLAPIEEVDLYGTWYLDEISVDAKASGEDLGKVMLTRTMIIAFKGRANDELNAQIDTMDYKFTFLEDHSFMINLFEEADSGTWVLYADDRYLELSSDTLSIDGIYLERLNEESLVISWESDASEFAITDSSDNSLNINVKLKAWLIRE